jgi:exodeoxyribonuclease V alpha subunit
MKEEKTGSVKELIFHNDSNFFTILLFESTEEQFFAVGKMPDPRKGRSYRLTGEWTEHPKYGEQFAFSSFEELEPTSAEGIASFLASGIIKNVGPSTAMAIVRRFGDDTLRVIAEDPDKLTLVSGIGPVKAKAIAEGYAAHRSYAQVVLKLSAYDISPAVCMKLYKAYGSEAAEVVKENPYRLIDSIYGIGFVKADRIAQKLGIPADSPFRLRSAVVYDLEYHAGLGDTFVPETDLTEDVAVMLDVPREDVSSAIFDLALDGRVFKENLDGQNIVTLASYRRAENYCAAKLLQLINCDLTAIPVDPARLIKRSEKAAGIELSETQRRAVMSSLGNGVSIITGGPGTGKTTIIRMILSVLEEAGIPTELAAPTGRAAKRMSQASGREAQTIHRLLEYSYEESTDRMVFGKNREDPLTAGCVIIDEISMVDILLMEGLLAAIKPGTRLILVGDADQLPPVGAGTVIADLLDSGIIHSTRLTEIFRQAQESMIVVNAHAIDRGERPEFNGRGSDCFFLERSGDKEISATIKQLCESRLPGYFGHLDPYRDIQVLTPVRKGICGCMELNKTLQEALNPPSPEKHEKAFGDKVFREGDKVMHIKNDYMLEWKDLNTLQSGTGVFNGDMGIVSSIDSDTGAVNVLYDGDRLVSYDFTNLDELEPAFAITVHKSQGSEFPVVVMPMTHFPPMLATRNLLYTAITRAKEGVVMVGDPRMPGVMTDNTSARKRNSGLKARLVKLWETDYEHHGR